MEEVGRVSERVKGSRLSSMSVKVRKGSSVVDSLLVGGGAMGGGDEAITISWERSLAFRPAVFLIVIVRLSLKSFLSGAGNDPGYVPVKFHFP